MKLSRSGQLIWQFGGSMPKDQTKFFTGVPTWSVNHGHQLLSDGTFLFFNNGSNEGWGYTLNTTNMTATKILGYTASGAPATSSATSSACRTATTSSPSRPPDKSTRSAPTGTLVAKFTSPSFGYSEFRESLYGAPPY